MPSLEFQGQFSAFLLDSLQLALARVAPFQPWLMTGSTRGCFMGLPIWVWINTYENTILSGMNIHKSQLF
jgi:hypothetical protein